MSETVSTSQVGKVCPQCGLEYPFEQRFCPNDGTTLRAKNATGDLVGTIIADRYHVVKKLGEGGMGQVYLAEHVKMGRKSAVKVMNPGMTQDPDAISRFNREASNASRINHPNVAAIYDFGETPEGIIYLAMEYVEGDSLTKVIETNGALPPKRAGNILKQAGEALAVAHDLGIVHRDLKPDNIMIAAGREDVDLVKVVDFGIAKAGNSENQKVTKTGLVVGTPEYMSPEQLAGDKLDGRSDIYSLGLVAFNMLTGKLPFPSETVQESMIMRLTDRPRTLIEMHPHVDWPQKLQDVMDKALARAAKDRYTSAAQFGRDFAVAVEGMSEIHHTEAGTMVLGAPVVPATRIASANAPAANAGAGGTLKQEAIAPPPARVEAPKSKTPMMIASGIGTVAIAAIVFVFATREKTPPVANAVTGDTAAPSQVSQVKGTPAGTTAPATKQSDVQPLSRPTNPGSAPGAAVIPPAAPQSYAVELVRLRRVAEDEDPAVARTALARIDALLPKLTIRSESLEARFLRGVALYQSNDVTAACALFRELSALSDVQKDQSMIDAFVTGDGCKGR